MGKRGPKFSITPLHHTVWDLYRQGFSYREMAEKANVSLSTIQSFLQKGFKHGYISRHGHINHPANIVDSIDKVKRNKYYYRMIQVCWLYNEGYTYRYIANCFNLKISDVNHYLSRGVKFGIITRRNCQGTKGRLYITARTLIMEHLSHMHQIDNEIRPFTASGIGMYELIGKSKSNTMKQLMELYKEGKLLRKKTWTKPNPSKKAHLYTYRIKR